MRVDNLEIQEVLLIFPKLKYTCNENGRNIINGKIEFSAKFIEEFRAYQIFNYTEKKYDVRWFFDIVIDIHSDNPFREVFEVWWEIQRIAEKEGQELIDLHSKIIDWKTNVCLTWYLQENYDITFKEFLFGYVIPFFADILYFEKHKFWPRGEFKHNIPWLFESFYDFIWNQNTNKEQGILRLLKELEHIDKSWIYIDLIFYNKIKKGHFKTENWAKIRNLFWWSKAFKWFCYARELVKKFNIKNITIWI